MAFLDLRDRLLIGRVPLPLWAALGAGAICYFLAAQLGLAFASTKAVSPFWPAAGLAVALLLQFGLRMWPAVAVGAFAPTLCFSAQASR
jgi:integral membrane sensor domain MASE1